MPTRTAARRICREIADSTFDEETARELDRLAEDCLKAAGETDPGAWNLMFRPAAGALFNS
jgi:hypothetical protein